MKLDKIEGTRRKRLSLRSLVLIAIRNESFSIFQSRDSITVKTDRHHKWAQKRAALPITREGDAQISDQTLD